VGDCADDLERALYVPVTSWQGDPHLVKFVVHRYDVDGTDLGPEPGIASSTWLSRIAKSDESPVVLATLDVYDLSAAASDGVVVLRLPELDLPAGRWHWDAKRTDVGPTTYAWGSWTIKATVSR
jgi:hypothetical protein